MLSLRIQILFHIETLGCEYLQQNCGRVMRVVINMRKILIDGRTGVMFASLLFFVLLYPLTKPFPYTDDWSYIFHLVNLTPLDISWVFAQHNDHRIPIQKILHLVLLKLSGGDFRILIATNVIVLAATSVCWIMLSRMIAQKGSSMSEWLVPSVLLGFGFNTVEWGFNFQFVSGLFFLSLANLLWVRAIYIDRGNLGGESFLALTLCAWCGGNGLVTSSIVGSGFLSAILYTRGFRGLSWKIWSSSLVWGVTILVIWMRWKGSSATEVMVNNPEQYVHFGLEMSKSWFGIFAIQNAALKTVFAFFVLLIGLGGSFLLILRTKMKDPSYLSPLIILPVFLSALQAVAMIIVIAYSRAGSQPWWPGLELHYGSLVTALPLSAWIVILMLPKQAMRKVLLGILALVIASAYVSNAVWRMNAERDEYRQSAAVVADIISPMSVEDVAHRHIREFYWVGGAQAESAVSNGLTLLRKTAFWSQRKSE
jgi:hypothetical protein